MGIKPELFACKQCGCVWARITSILVHSKCPACGSGNKEELEL